MCNCYSNNLSTLTGTDQPTDMFINGKLVSIDACIAHVIKHLNNNGVCTSASCCSHNGRFGKPSIIIESDATPREAQLALDLIAEVDPRPFSIQSWTLIDVLTEQPTNCKKNKLAQGL